MHYLLMYEVGDDYLQRRGDYRAAHLKLAWQAEARTPLEHGSWRAGCDPGSLTNSQH